MPNLEPPNEATLLRMIWCPDDVVDGKVQLSAFPRSELEGTERFASVDRLDLVVAEVCYKIAARQQQRANAANNIRRHSPLWAHLNAGQARAIRIQDRGEIIDVFPDPIDDGEPSLVNPAHCGIRNNSGEKKKSFLLSIQQKLVDLIFELKEAPN